ncbi:MAG TPA: cobyric acid synthase [Gemmataceae bacterium]|nr:cobyric acid synthase [Gemmataceae bacterium]
MPAKTLMLQGTSSSVGKSVLTAALCRFFARRGLRVAPFKAQNMSNNAAVCGDGGEIGRAQAVQAAAAGIAPTPDLNPVLLKPEADSRSQVIVLGRPWRTLRAGSYYRRKEELWPIVTAALDRLRAAYELVIIEGAGSPVELNLRAFDMANMAVAQYAASPVLLVGDIDRGGIFAQLLGTLWLLPDEERALVRGMLVNKFRGDRGLFADGGRILEERGGIPLLGVIPYLKDLALPEEDSVALDTDTRHDPSGVHDIAIVRLPHIANFDDFDPLRSESGVRLRYVDSVAALGAPSAVILPGTKCTLADLIWLTERGLAEAIRRLAERGTAVVGICGGYQMLGRTIRDPERVESSVEEMPGLGLLPVETVFAVSKETFQSRARIVDGPSWLAALHGQTVEGYEIHTGRTESACPWLEIVTRNGEPVQRGDGAVNADGRVWGCYLHGLFANPSLRRAWLDALPSAGSREAAEAPLLLDSSLNRLADALEAVLDRKQLETILAAS